MYAIRSYYVHCDFAVNLYNNHIKYKLSESKIKEILLSALNVEREFITESLPVCLIGMNASLMTRYLEYVTDRLLIQLGCEKQFVITSYSIHYTKLYDGKARAPSRSRLIRLGSLV